MIVLKQGRNKPQSSYILLSSSLYTQYKQCEKQKPLKKSYPVKSCGQGQQSSSNSVLLRAGTVLWVRQQGTSESRSGHSRTHVTQVRAPMHVSFGNLTERPFVMAMCFFEMVTYSWYIRIQRLSARRWCKWSWCGLWRTPLTKDLSEANKTSCYIKTSLSYWKLRALQEKKKDCQNH